MKLAAAFILYLICVALINAVLLRLFGGRNPSEKATVTFFLIALVWPLWPELALVVIFIFVAKMFMAFCNAIQEQIER